jgi:hypothetical protein
MFNFRKKGVNDIGITKDADVRIIDEAVLHSNIIASNFVKGSLIGVSSCDGEINLKTCNRQTQPL